MTKLHIFDCDGTVLDSMRMWDHITIDYLRSLGYNPVDELAETLDPMTFPEAVSYIVQEFDLPEGMEGTYKGIMDRVLWHYENDIRIFPEMAAELEDISKEGQPMVLLTNSPRNLIEVGLGRNGVLHYFNPIYISHEMGLPKTDPEIFRQVCREMNTDPADALVYEDSSFAIDAAREAGCRVKVYDRYR